MCRPFVYRISKSRIIDHLRRKYRRLPQAGGPLSGNTARTSIEDRIAQGEDALSHETAWMNEWETYVFETALNRVKARLPAKHHLAFRMCTQQEKSPGEVAKSLGLSLPNVYLIRHRVGRMVAAEIEHLRDGR